MEIQSTSNQYTSVHRPKRRKKRPSRNIIPKPMEESDSDCVVPQGGCSIPRSAAAAATHQIDFSQWDPSPKKKKQPIRIPTPSE